jgi:hypothetical protein
MAQDFSSEIGLVLLGIGWTLNSGEKLQAAID